METLEGMEETEQLQQARSDSDIPENQEERLVRKFRGLEVREQKMREELSIEWKGLRQRLSNLICHIDGQMASLSAEEKRMEERRDESYWKGVQDLDEAVKLVATDIEDGGMALRDVEKYLGARLIADAICKNDSKTIMEKVSEWKADKERAQKEDEEFHVGDEVKAKDNYLIGGSKAIVTDIDNDRLHVVFRCRFDNNHMDFFSISKDGVTKTGRHFDSIPFSYWQEEEEEQEDSEFHVGDEVVSKEVPPSYSPVKGIITKVNHTKVNYEYLNIIWPNCKNGSLIVSTVYADNYTKTGRHFDSIPLTYGQEESDAE